MILQTGETEAGNLEGLEVPEKDIVLDNYRFFAGDTGYNCQRSFILSSAATNFTWRISLLQQVQPANRSLDVDVLHASAKALFSLAIDYYNDYFGVWEPLLNYGPWSFLEIFQTI